MSLYYKYTISTSENNISQLYFNKKKFLPLLGGKRMYIIMGGDRQQNKIKIYI